MSSTKDSRDDHSLSDQDAPRHGLDKPSVTSPATSQTYASTISDGVATKPEISAELVQASEDVVPVDIVSFIRDGRSVSHRPERAREWLMSLGHFQHDTDVSLRLRPSPPSSTPDSPTSILPLLTEWVNDWYEISYQKRKTEKLPKDATFPEQENFAWLLKYTADYISLGHTSLNEFELRDLVVAVTGICQKTGRADDVDAGIQILLRIMTHAVFPDSVLTQSLEVVCAATVILPSPIPEISTCINLLLTGPAAAETIDILLGFVVTPTVQNNSQNLTYARGALRLLRIYIDLAGEEVTFVLNLDRLLETLYQASKCCIFRFCSEILNAYSDVLASRQAELLLSQNERFMQMVDAIENCTRTVLPRTRSYRTLSSIQSPDRDQVIETEKLNRRYLSERNAAIKTILSSLEQSWPRLSNVQQNRVCDFFMEHARDSTEEQSSLAIGFLQSSTPAFTSIEEWVLRLHKIFDTFVRNAKVSSTSRLIVVKLCTEAAGDLASRSINCKDDHAAVLLSAGQKLVDRLLGQLASEVNTTVVRGTCTALLDIAFFVGVDNKTPYAELIMRKLLWSVKNERDGEDDISDEHVVVFTVTIQQIFLKSLTYAPTLTSRAFDALLTIAHVDTNSRRCRLAALRLLVRLRCNTDGMLYLQTAPDCEYIAAALCRTQEAYEAFDQEAHHKHQTSPAGAIPSHFSGPKPLWNYPDEIARAQEWNLVSASQVGVRGVAALLQSDQEQLRMSDWLVTVIECLQADSDWETYSFLLVHLGGQLFNTKLFSTSLEAIVKLRQILCNQISNNNFKEPPAHTGLKKSDAALCIFNMLSALIPYATMKSDSIQKGFGEDLVRAFLAGISGVWEGTARGCIHAMCLCGFEIPQVVASAYPTIITKMSKSMSQPHLTIHILEFLTQIARLPEVHSNFTQDEVTLIFGICTQFLEKAREQKASLTSPSPRSGTPARHSGLSLRRPPYRAAMLQDIGLPQYAAALAYHVLIFWFLSLKLDVRAKYVSWIIPRLVYKNSFGDEVIDEQSQAFVDMMQRTAYSDLGETKPDPNFAASADGAISTCSWIVGLSVITAETEGSSGATQITKRQASGTTHAFYRQLTMPQASHQVPTDTEIRPEEDSRFDATKMLPQHILLQMVSTAAPISLDDQPILLPVEDWVVRALTVFDRMPTVDSIKLGIIYVGNGQSQEADFLSNTNGSGDYHVFLQGIGYKVSLEPPLEYNPQGLQYERDGQDTIAWRDRIVEIVYHVPTMMPNNLEDDPACTLKKSHVGNCNVLIVFNESGKPWMIENFTSAVTFVHIVIEPADKVQKQMLPDSLLGDGDNEARSHFKQPPCNFFRVHVLTKADYPNVTPAADPKVISKAMLPKFVRMFAINANLFAQSKVANDSGDAEYPSSWRARLQAIKRLKERTIDRQAGGNVVVTSGPPSRNASVMNVGTGRRTPLARSEDGHDDEEERDGNLVHQLDFAKWTL